MNTSFWATAALLDQGWATAVRMEVVDGAFTLVESGQAPRPGDVQLDGPALPGLPNLHSHAFQRALAGLTQTAGPPGVEDSFWTWREVMYRFVDRLDADDVRAVAAWLGVELLEGGFTRIAEFHYLHHQADGRPHPRVEELARAVVAGLREAGLGVTLLPVLYQTGDFGGRPAGPGQRRFLCETDQLLTIVEAMAAEPDPELVVGLAPHSLRAVPPRALEEAVAAVHRHSPHAPVHVHIAEQPREVAACLEWSGQRPVAWLLDHAPVDGRWCLVHATHVRPEEVAGMARSGAVLGLCPTTEADLGDGIFPLEGFLGAGGRFGVGTDSHVGRSAPGELALLEYGQRLQRGGRNLVRPAAETSTGGALWRAACAGGAQALGQRCGRTAPGHRADLVVLDGDHPSLIGREGDALLDSYLFADARDALLQTVVAGEIQVQQGRHRDRERHQSAYVRTLRRLLARSG
jgi:formimidoylglutamate deiminase